MRATILPALLLLTGCAAAPAPDALETHRLANLVAVGRVHLAPLSDPAFQRQAADLGCEAELLALITTWSRLLATDLAQPVDWGRLKKDDQVSAAGLQLRLCLRAKGPRDA